MKSHLLILFFVLTLFVITSKANKQWISVDDEYYEVDEDVLQNFVNDIMKNKAYKAVISNDSQCTSQGGKCMNPKSCNGTVKSGLCPGGDDNKCCIQNNNNGSKCTSQGGKCMNPSNCSGTVISGLCPGGENNKCCIQNTNKCTSQGGKCMNPSNCNGTVKSGLCPGGENNKCCIQNTNKCTSQGGKCMNPSNCNGTIRSGLCPGGANNKCCFQNTNKCTNQGGKCMNPSNCSGTVISGLCPGGANNKCCFSYNPDGNSGTTKTYISDIFDAIDHYRGKSGQTVYADSTLIGEIKSAGGYKDIIKDLEGSIKDKITDAKIKNGTEIKAADGSYRSSWCLTLGSHSLNIDYSFVPHYGNNSVRIHFWGSDRWDFENNDSYNFIENLIEERIPSLIAGDGKPFDVKYDFYDTVTVTY